MVAHSRLAATRTHVGHIEAPSATTVPRRQTFRRSAISAGLLCLSTWLWSPRTRRYAGLISCSVPGLNQWIMGGRAALPPWLLISSPTDLPSSLYSARSGRRAGIFKTAPRDWRVMRFVRTNLQFRAHNLPPLTIYSSIIILFVPIERMRLYKIIAHKTHRIFEIYL